MIVISLRLQLDYRKYCCFLCETDTYTWTKRCFVTPLVKPGYLLRQSKLLLVKNFVHAVDKTRIGCLYSKEKFPKISDVKKVETFLKGINERLQ